jgi:tRNA(fMet)-specific endonuclease VapC
LLDTAVFVHVAREDATGAHLLSRYRLKQRAERPLYSTVSEGEILALSRYWKWGRTKRDRLQQLLAELVRVDAGLREIIEAYADLHANSLSHGLNLGDNDMWIAATGRVAGAVVLTTDSDFQRVPPAFVRIEYVAAIK